MTIEDWDKRVPRAQEKCTKCGREFAIGDEYLATVRLASTGIVREDRCLSCGEALEAGVFSHWRARRAAGTTYARRLDFDSLLELFRRLEGHEDDQSSRLRWIVAILLLRRRLLVQTGREQDGEREVLLLKPKHEEHVFRVVDPGLDDDAFATMRDDLARIFNLDPKPA